MAEVLDINILCKKIWDFDLIKNGAKNHNMDIKNII